MPGYRIVGGVPVTTPEGVFENYRPAPHNAAPEEWAATRQHVLTACRAADYPTVGSALTCIGVVARFYAWAHRYGMDMDPETLFAPSNVERYCTHDLTHLAESSQSNHRGYLRRVARAATQRAPWPEPPHQYVDGKRIQPPYTPDEVEDLWDAACAQKTERRTRAAQTMLALGLGAGLKPHEIAAVTADDIRVHPENHRLMVVLLPDRHVPVLQPWVDPLQALARTYTDGTLTGATSARTKDPLGVARQGIVWPRWIQFRPVRLRTTWMASVLSQDVRMSEFMVMAGTVSAKSLEEVAPHVPGRWSGDEYLLKGAGL